MGYRLLKAVMCCIALCGAANGLAAEPRVVEFTDNEYGYAFQHPADWKPTKLPQRGEGDGVRVMLQSPGGAVIMATVGTLDASLSRRDFERSRRKGSGLYLIVPAR